MQAARSNKKNGPATQKADPFVLSADGAAGVEAGTPWSAVSRYFNRAGAYVDEGAEGCEVYTHRSGKFAAMVLDGRIARIEVDGPGVRTEAGIGIGSTLSQMREAYGKSLVAEANPYDGEDVQFVWQSKQRGLVFYMQDGRVRFMAGGGNAIRFAEGCY